jgi:hypothetical protein
VVGGGLVCTLPIVPLHDKDKGDIRSLECFLYALSMSVFGPLLIHFIYVSLESIEQSNALRIENKSLLVKAPSHFASLRPQ